MVKRIVLVLLLIGWLLVIFNFSNATATVSGYQSKAVLEDIISNGLKVMRKLGIVTKEYTSSQISDLADMYHAVFRKLCHVFVYLVLAVFVSATINNFVTIKFRLVLLFTLLFCFCYSISDEYHQLYVAGRSGDFVDCLIDTTGAIIGILVYYSLHRLKEAIKQKFINRKNKKKLIK